MHEAAITDSMVRLVLDQARAHGARVVRRVRVTVGGMSGIVPESMRFYFEELTAETPAEGAALEIRVVPTRAACLSCGHDFVLEDAYGRVLSRDQILNKVWGYDYEGTARTIDNFINKLRSKIEDDPARPRYILTVRGVGYKFAD